MTIYVLKCGGRYDLAWDSDNLSFMDAWTH